MNVFRLWLKVFQRKMKNLLDFGLCTDNCKTNTELDCSFALKQIEMFNVHTL